MDATPSPSSRLRPILWLLVIVSILLFGVVALTPTILSTEWGKRLIENQINSRINGSIEIKELSISWFRGQTVKGVTVSDNSRHRVVYLSEATTATSLIPLLFGRLSSDTALHGLQLTLVPYANGATNIDYLLKRTSVLPSDGQLPAVKLLDVEAEGKTSPALELHLKGKTLVETREGSFDVTVSGKPHSDEISVNVDIKEFPVLLIDQVVALKTPALKGSLPSLLGDTLNINVKQELHSEEKGKKAPLYNLLLKIVGEKAKVTVETSPGVNDSLVAIKFAAAGIDSTPLLLNVGDSVSLREAATVQVDITADSLQKALSSALPFHVSAATPVQVVIKEFESPVAPAELLSASLAAAVEVQNIVLQNIPGVDAAEILTATLELSSKELKETNINLTAKVKLPSTQGLLAKAAGEPFSLSMQGVLLVGEDRKASVENIALNIQNSAARVSLKGRLTKSNELVLTTPALVEWSEKEHTMRLMIEPLVLSLNNPEINTLNASLSLEGVSDEIIALEWNASTQTLKAIGSLNRFPVGALSAELEAVFGAEVSGDIAASIKGSAGGPLKLSLQGQKGSVSLDGRIQEGILYLNKPIEGHVTASEELGRLLLKKVVPFLGGLVAADNPITFSVAADKFTLPLFPFNIERAVIGGASVSFGNMQFRNGGSLAKLLSILKPGKSPFLSLWFTPLYLSLRDGVLRIERVDLLLQNRYPLAAWGAIDLGREIIDMEVGLSAMTIAHAFKVQVGSPDTYIAVPLRGSLKDPTFDKASATAQITSMVAKSQAGTPGMILGTVLQIASTGNLNPGAGVPPPTTDPLPWEGRLTMEEPAPEIPVTKPIKAISEGAEKLLKNIFR